MKCKHLNFDLIERYTGTWTWEFTDGKPPESGEGFNSFMPDATGEVSIRCRDCPYTKTFRRKKPKWLEKAIEALEDERSRQYMS